MASSSQVSVLSCTKIISHVAIRWGWCDFFLLWSWHEHFPPTFNTFFITSRSILSNVTLLWRFVEVRSRWKKRNVMPNIPPRPPPLSTTPYVTNSQIYIATKDMVVRPSPHCSPQFLPNLRKFPMKLGHMPHNRFHKKHVTKERGTMCGKVGGLKVGMVRGNWGRWQAWRPRWQHDLGNKTK